MTIKTEQELLELRKIGTIVATILKQMQARVEPGMTTAELDQIGGQLLEHYEAESAPRLTYNFPGDGWTLVGARGNLSAQFEHSMVITRGKPILLTVA